MKAHTHKTQENKSPSAANPADQKQSGSAFTFQFVHHRPEALAQKELQTLADHNQRAVQLKAFQDLVNSRPQAQHAAQLQAKADEHVARQHSIQKKAIPSSKQAENNTGLPHNLKSGIENLSGYAMDDVRVHYNSSQPAQMQAHAFAQGTDIHLAPGQEKHLPHEAWHVVQQKQGRVKPTLQLKGNLNINDNAGLEREADAKGAMALKMPISKREGGDEDHHVPHTEKKQLVKLSDNGSVFQRKVIARIRTTRAAKDSPRTISELRIEGRAPTTVPGSQGDHTVAETLINESVHREVMHQQPLVALNNLMVLARLTLPESGIDELNENFYAKYWGTIAEMEGEDQNTIIEEMIQRYIELANKREATAFLRDEELTRGNKGERTAIGGVRELADKLEQNQSIGHSDLALAARHLAVLIDMRFDPLELGRYAMIIQRAVQHAVLSVLPQLTKDQVQFMLEMLMAVLGKRDGISSENQSKILGIIMPNLGM